MPKVLKSSSRNLWWKSEYKKSTSFLTSFLRYCKDIANLLFSELWECLTIPIKIKVSIYQKPYSYRHEKINFITHFFLKTLQKNSKFFGLGDLDTSGYTHKMIVSIWRNFLAFICKIKLNFIVYVYDVLQRYCKLVILGTLGFPGIAHPKWYYQLAENFLVYLQAKN